MKCNIMLQMYVQVYASPKLKSKILIFIFFHFVHLYFSPTKIYVEWQKHAPRWNTEVLTITPLFHFLLSAFCESQGSI